MLYCSRHGGKIQKVTMCRLLKLNTISKVMEEESKFKEDSQWRKVIMQPESN